MSSVSATRLQLLCLGAVFLVDSFKGVVLTSNDRRLLEYEVYEELPLGTTVGDVKTDSNLHLSHSESDLARLRFSLRSSSSSSYSSRLFSIDEVLGVIRTSMSIDREILCPYKLDCRIDLEVNVLPREFFQKIRVVVNVLDLNDNTPIFTENRVSLSLARTSPTGSLLNLPSADDLDSGKLGVQRYHLVSDSDKFELSVSDLFDGSNDLALRLVQRLDDEDAGDRYSMAVIAVDGGIPPKSGSVAVEVVILDSRSGLHRFENDSYETAIVENLPPGTTVLVVRATAPSRHLAVGGGSSTKDSPSLSYGFMEQTELLHGRTFGIRKTTGEIFLKEALDYEAASSYQLTVTATAAGTGAVSADQQQQQQQTATSFTRVTIHVLDENDNAPEVTVNNCNSSSRCTVQVTENSDPEQFVAHFSVIDSDSGDNGEVNCSLSKPSLFHMTAPYKSDYIITTATRFDRETMSEHLLTVSCTDHGSVALTTAVSILVKVLDVNDHAPEIMGGEEQRVAVELMENNRRGVELVKLNATDRDTGNNSQLMFQLEPVNGTPVESVSLDAVTGSVRANQIFDCEQTRTYVYNVTITDHGLPALSTVVTLQLDILDENDNVPVFDEHEYHFQVRENNELGFGVGQVRATDADFSPEFNRVVYRFPTYNSKFHIDRYSGKISAKVQLDREENALYILTVIASNDVTSSSDAVLEPRQITANITISVIDENDNSPIIANKNKYIHPMRIARDTENGTVITKVEGWDADVGPSAALVYSVTSGNEDARFEMTKETGLLKLTNNVHLANLYRLTAKVSDCGDPPLAASVQLVVEVVDILEPKFPSTKSDSLSGSWNGLNLFVVVGVILGVLLLLVIVFLSCLVTVCIRRKGKSLRSRRLATARGLRDVAEGEAEDEADVEHRGGSDCLYTEVTRSLELAQAVCRSMEVSKNSTLTRDGKLLEDFFPNWSLGQQSCASCGVSRPTTGSLPREKPSCGPSAAAPHHHHRRRRHRHKRHRCGSAKPCTHLPQAAQLCHKCGSSQPSICQSSLGQKRTASSAGDTLEKRGHISQKDIKPRDVRQWSWHIRTSDHEDSTDSSLTSSSLYTDSGQGPSGDDDHNDASQYSCRRLRQTTSWQQHEGGLEGRQNEANELNAVERSHKDEKQNND